MDQQQISQLFDKYEQPLIRYVWYMVKDEELAKDIVQDVFIKLIRQTEEPGNVNAWLYTVSRNLVIDHVRRGKKVITHEDYHHLDKGVEEVDRVQESEEAVELKKHIESLSPVEREIVYLKYYDDKSYKEISNITGKSVSNVGFILHQAIKKLKELIKTQNGKNNVSEATI